jgi:hypothetical protein
VGHGGQKRLKAWSEGGSKRACADSARRPRWGEGFKSETVESMERGRE